MLNHTNPRRVLRRLVLTGLACVMTVVFIFPVYWIVSLSFQDGLTSSRLPPSFIFVPTLDNYVQLLESSGFTTILSNTVVITVGTTALALLLGLPAGYSLARFRLASSETILFGILSIRMVPSYATVVPLFIILQTIGLYGSSIGVIIACSLVGVSFVIWMSRAFFVGVPVELEQAAMIDGCSRIGAICRVVLPVIAPGLVATAVFTAISAWNEFLLVLILGGEGGKTITVALAGLVTEQRAEWGQLAAGGAMAMLPVIIFAVLVRKYFLAGLSAGSMNS